MSPPSADPINCLLIEGGPMLLDTIKQFNWVDILVVILLFRIGYIAIKNGLAVGFFKLLGALFAIYLSLHYYTGLSDFVRGRIGIKKLPLEFLDFLFFVALASLGYLIFVLLRTVFCHFIKTEAAPKLNQWGGFILGAVRGFLCVGLITFMLAISSVSYLKNSVKDSYSGRYLFKFTTDTYSWLWNAVTSKFMTGEKFNKTILEVQEGLTKK